MPLKLVCDTNTLVSGFLWRGNEFRLLKAVTERKATLFISPAILLEFSRVIKYERLRPLVMNSVKLTNKLAEMCIVVKPREYVKVVKEDPSDDRILECAIAADVDYIVSGDKKHLLKLKKFHNIPIVTTKAILEVL